MTKVSVVMPVYNGEKYLRQAIDSILNQSFSDFEFIIINDCSTDATEQIIKSYDDKRIVYVKNDNNIGVAESLNRGFDIAKGEYIARMDADDISLPQRFEKQIEFMDKHNEYGLCGCDIIKFDDNGNEKQFIYSHSDDEIKVDLLFDSPLPHPGIMIRRTVDETIDLHYDREYEKAEDFELWTRMAEKVRFYNIPEFLLKYREHNLQVSNACNEQQVESCKKIRYNNLIGAVGRSLANEYIDVFNDFCNHKIGSQYEYDRLCNCFREILNSKKYNKKVLSKQLSMIKINLAKKKLFKVHINSYMDIMMLIKVKLSELKA